MMSIGQTFAVTMRRINKKWNKLAAVILVFLIPSILASIVAVAVQLIVSIKTGCNLSTFMLYFMGGLTEEQITELQIDPNVMQRTLLILMPMYSASSLLSIASLFFTLPMSAYFLNVVRNRDLSLGEAMKFAWKSFTLSLMMILKLIPWFLLFIIPGIVKAIQYSQAYYIRYDHPDWSALKCIKHSCKVTEGRKGRLFLYMIMLGAISGVAQNLISNLILPLVLLSGIGMVSSVITAVVDVAATVAFSAYFGVFEQTLYAVYYEDARRSYIDDVERQMRSDRERGFGDNHGDPFASGSDSDVTYVGEATTVDKKNDGSHGDPFGD